VGQLPWKSESAKKCVITYLLFCDSGFRVWVKPCQCQFDLISDAAERSAYVPVCMRARCELGGGSDRKFSGAVAMEVGIC
jgi:hypothetical protein